MVEHRSHSAGLEYDASAGWKLRKLGRDIRRRRRHLRLVNDRAVSRHDANLRFRHRHVQPGKILHVGSPLPMTKPILSASAEEPRPLPDVEKVEKFERDENSPNCNSMEHRRSTPSQTG